jgi:tetratricopeptide (TPR) repeat protein/TolB-like protein
MGEVFLGLDTRLHRRVALKRLTAISGAHDESQARLFREARATARLTHPNIAAIYDVLEDPAGVFIVMEYVEGESLAGRLTHGPLAPVEVRTILRQLASALAAAHAQGVVHRDLKPANIHITPDGTVKVLDFGIAKLTAPTADASADTTNQPPPDGTLDGTPGTPIFMSPEQLFGLEVDGRSDIYSAGVIAFQMATGRRPFLETNAAALAFAIKTTPAPTAASVNPEVPQDLSEVIAKALASEPRRRFQTSREFESALAGQSTTTLLDTPATIRSRFARRWTLGAAAVLILAVAFAAGRAPVMQRLGIGNPMPASRSTVLAILPVENPTGDLQGDYLGAGMASVVAQNLAAITGFRVLSRAATAPYGTSRSDLSALAKDLSADYVLDLTLQSTTPVPKLAARLRRPGVATPYWEQTFSGESTIVERSLLEGLGHAVERIPGRNRKLSAGEWTHVLQQPTASAEALSAYSEARALLDRPNVDGNLARATTLLQRAIQLDSSFGLAHAALGDCYLEQYRLNRDPELARRATGAVLQSLRVSPDASGMSYYSLGNVQYATGRSQEAIVSLRRSLELQPENDDAHALLGRILAERGDADAGAAEIRKAIQLRATYWRHYMTLGSALYRGGRLPEALNAYRRASELQPNEPEPYSGLGLIYQVMGDLSQAIGNYEHAVRLGQSATAYSNLGFAYYGAARYTDAIEAWNRALAIAPKSVLYHRNIGDAYRRLRQPARAAAAYEKAIAIGEELLKVNPQDVDTIALTAVCEAKAGRKAAAVRHAAEALALAPASRLALQRSAEVHALVGDRKAALKDLAAAIERGYMRSIARTNDEFESLRNDLAFQALVAEPPVTQQKER